MWRRRVARIASRNKHRVDPGKLPEDLAPFFQRKLHCRRVRVVLIHGRVPDPDIQVVVGQKLRHPDHHLHGRQRKVRAVRIVIRARRDQLDGVGAEHHEVPDILLPHRQRPGIVRVRLRSVSQLMPPKRKARRGGDIRTVRQGDATPFHVQRAQQAPHAEQDSSGIAADDEDDRRCRALNDPYPISLRARGTGLRLQFPSVPSSPGADLGFDADGNDGPSIFRPRRARWPADLGPLLHLLDEHRRRLGASGRTGGGDDGCTA